jgi:ABC-2 type transport system permease protein
MTSSTLTPTSASGEVLDQPPRRERSRFALGSDAFIAILRRDLVVTGREFISFLMQVLGQPLFFLFIFGRVLPSIGLATPGFSALLLPGIVALTAMLMAMQGVTLPLVLDLGFQREIDDRLLAPIPIFLVAVEKILFAALRGIVAAGIIFPLAWWILGDGYSVRDDRIGTIVGIIALISLAGACLGLLIGTLIKPEQLGLMFALIMTPLLFTGCTYYPWTALSGIKWFQIVTLFNPLTYGAEGLRYAMVPALQVHNVSVTLATLDLQWVLLGLSATIIACFVISLTTFRHRVIS